MIEREHVQPTKTEPSLAKVLAIEASAKLLASGPIVRTFRDMCDIQTTPELLAQLSEYRKMDYGLMIDSTHTTWGDGLFLSFAVREISRDLELDGARQLVAESMGNGAQGVTIKAFYDAFKPRLAKNRLFLYDSIRPQDRAQYGMKGSRVRNIVEVLQAPEKNMAIVMFGEGSVQAGRLNADGKPYGQQKPNDETIGFYQRVFTRYDGKIVVLPVAIIGSRLILPPDTKSLSPYARQEIMKRLIPGHHQSKIITVAFGAPYTVQNMVDDGVDLTDTNQVRSYLMYKKSEIIPEEMQGAYKLNPTDA